MRPVFFIGNKRSGTTFLMKILNKHPNVFISNESDLLWILFRLYNNLELIPYEWDSPKGYDVTLRGGYIDRLDITLSVRDNFFSILNSMMQNGFNSVKATDKSNVLYMGDQKMFQHADPEILPFIIKEFPDAKFIHLIRHPYHVVRSSKNFKQETGTSDDDNIWDGMSDKQIEDRWLMHEKWVLEAKKTYDIDCIDIRYENLSLHLGSELQKLLKFLDLPVSKSFINECQKSKYVKIKPTDLYRITPEVSDVVSEYKLNRYSWMYTSNSLKVKLINSYFGLERILRRLF